MFNFIRCKFYDVAIIQYRSSLGNSLAEQIIHYYKINIIIAYEFN
jgi:hypothetical protein